MRSRAVRAGPAGLAPRLLGGDDCTTTRVDVAKANHAIGAVGDDGQPLCKSMEFKNSGCRLREVLGVAGGPGRGAVGRLVGMEATGHYWMALFAIWACRRGLQRVRDQPHGGQGRPQAQGQVEGQNPSGRGAAHRRDPCASASTWRPSWPPTSAVNRTLATRYRQARRRPPRSSIRLTCVMDSLLPEYAGVFSDMFGSASLAVLEKSPMPSGAAQAQGAAAGQRQPEGRQAAHRAGQGDRAQGRREIQRRHNPRARRRRSRSARWSPRSARGARVRGRGAHRGAAHGHRAARAHHPRRVAGDRGPDRRRGGRREPLPAAPPRSSATRA